MRLTGYIRVSTTEQVNSGHGLDIQAETIRKWAKANGHKLTGIHRDEGISGKAELDDRAGLSDALGAIRYNGAEGLVVTSLDRLARSLTVQEAVLVQCWSAGGKVYATDTGEVLQDDPDDPVRTFVRQIMGAVSQLEAGIVARRLKRGRDYKAAQGGYIGHQPPYGQRVEEGQLVEDAAEMKALRQMRKMRADGDSLRTIIRYLEAEGIPAKRGGDAWHPSTVNDILNR